MLPDEHLGDPVELPLAWLDFYRETVRRKLDGLSDEELRTSQLPSGWTPLELLKHLVFMERRWLRWGFTAEQVDQPWGDSDAEERWRLEEGDTLEGLLAALQEGGNAPGRSSPESSRPRPLPFRASGLSVSARSACDPRRAAGSGPRT